MLAFKESSDPDSLTILRDGQWIGFLQRHKDRSPRLALRSGIDVVSLQELKTIMAEFDSWNKVEKPEPLKVAYCTLGVRGILNELADLIEKSHATGVPVKYDKDSDIFPSDVLCTVKNLKADLF